VGRARGDSARSSTRALADEVLAGLPLALANAEFYREVV
jgi:hypothetical protein